MQVVVLLSISQQTSLLINECLVILALVVSDQSFPLSSQILKMSHHYHIPYCIFLIFEQDRSEDNWDLWQVIVEGHYLRRVDQCMNLAKDLEDCFFAVIFFGYCCQFPQLIVQGKQRLLNLYSFVRLLPAFILSLAPIAQTFSSLNIAI